MLSRIYILFVFSHFQMYIFTIIISLRILLHIDFSLYFPVHCVTYKRRIIFKVQKLWPQQKQEYGILQCSRHQNFPPDDNSDLLSSTKKKKSYDVIFQNFIMTIHIRRNKIKGSKFQYFKQPLQKMYLKMTVHRNQNMKCKTLLLDNYLRLFWAI